MRKAQIILKRAGTVIPKRGNADKGTENREECKSDFLNNTNEFGYI